MVNNTDYTYKWANVEPSKTPNYTATQTLTVTGKGNYTGTKTATYVETRSTDYYFDVNHSFANFTPTNTGNSKTSGVGQFQVVVNDSVTHTLSQDNIGDYYQAIPYGVNWKITNIRAYNGYTYTGQSEYSGTMGNSAKSVVLT